MSPARAERMLRNPADDIAQLAAMHPDNGDGGTPDATEDPYKKYTQLTDTEWAALPHDEYFAMAAWDKTEHAFKEKQQPIGCSRPFCLCNFAQQVERRMAAQKWLNEDMTMATDKKERFGYFCKRCGF